MKTLLIFDWFGESELGIYLIPDAPDWLVQCDGHFGGGCDNREIEDLIIRVYDAICEQNAHLANRDDPLACMWVQHKVERATAVNLSTAMVVVTGWVP